MYNYRNKNATVFGTAAIYWQNKYFSLYLVNIWKFIKYINICLIKYTDHIKQPDIDFRSYKLFISLYVLLVY